MRTRIITFILTLLSILNVFTVFGQKLELEKASPFTAIKWEKDQPVVQYNNNWYDFEKLDHFSKKQILDFCKKKFGAKWQKRFSEDLVEVLQGMNYIPNKQVNLKLSKDGMSNTYTGTFTFENRQKCLMYNRKNRTTQSIKKSPHKISKEHALADLQQFQNILDSISSYAQLSKYDYTTAINKLKDSILSKKEEISVDQFTHNISKIMSEIGDRHSSIKNESFNKKDHKTYGLKLPFGITVVDEKIVAVKQQEATDNYTYLFSKYPYIKSINNIPIETLIEYYNYRDKKAPKETKRSRGAHAIQKYGALLFKNNKPCPQSVQVVFTDGKDIKKVDFELTTDKKNYVSKLSQDNFKTIMRIRQNLQFEDLSMRLNNAIGYIKLPMMYSYADVEGLEHFIENTLKEFSNTKALIIDIRDNPGGRRNILQTFAKYIVQPKQSPWVANVAYLRSDNAITSDEESMSNRYLYTSHSDKFSDEDRKAIQAFRKHFKTEKEFDHSKFSTPFYMVLHAGSTTYTKPIYILVNEKSFSAATVFTSAFKGLPNVTIVGVTTDGSSGNSRKMYLKNSNIRVKVSTMLSFQRNGKTLDGNGTNPDVYIPTDLEQTFTGKDTQLEKLIKMINQEN